MAKHSLFSASGAEGWAGCSGRLTLCKDAPRTTNYAADEGTAGHTLSERCITDGTDATDYVGEIIDVDGNEIEVTDDLAEACQTYIEYIRGISGIRWLEVRVNYADLLGVDEEDGFGTGDAVIVDDAIVNVCDAKFGRWYVDPYKNKQMILYAAGVVSSLETVGEQVDEIRLHIVQPRVSDKPVPYILTRKELFEQVAELRKAAQRVIEASEAYDGSDEWYDKYVTPGAVQCKYCPVAAGCRSLKKAVALDVDNDFELQNIMLSLPLKDLEDSYGRVELMEIWIKAVESELMKRLSTGEKGNSWKLVTGREGNRRWGDPAKVVAAFGDDPKLYQPAKLKSPAQLEKAFGKKDKRIVELPIVRNPAKPTLAEFFDPRAPWSPGASADEFDVVATDLA